MNELALFAGAGGGILGGQLLGWRTICAVECDAYAASILVQRQNDGRLPPFAIWDDVQTFDGRPWHEAVLMSFLEAFLARTSLAPEGEQDSTESRVVFSQKCGVLLARFDPATSSLRTPQCLLFEEGQESLQTLPNWGSIVNGELWEAHHTGAPHKRDRIWIVADSQGISSGTGPCQVGEKRNRDQPADGSSTLADSERTGLEGQSGDEQGGSESGRECAQAGRSTGQESLFGRDLASWWATEPDVGRVANGVAHRMDRLKCSGNGQVPQCAALAWRLLTEDIS